MLCALSSLVLAAAYCEGVSVPGTCAALGAVDVVWSARQRLIRAAVDEAEGGTHRDLTLNAGRDGHGQAEVAESLSAAGGRDYAAFLLPPDAWHKEYVLGGHPKAAAELYLKTSDMCGADLFSQPDLTCSLVAQDEVRAAHELADGFAIPRAFGVELEMVAKKPSAHVTEELGATWQRHSSSSGYPRDVFQQGSVRRAAIAVPDRNATQPAEGPPAAWVRNNVAEIPGVAFCVDAAAQGSARERGERWRERDLSGTPGLHGCRSDSDCSLSDFCTTARACRPRTECGDRSRPLSGVCPYEVASWRWETDCTVKVLSDSEVREVLPEAPAAERRQHTAGTGFELISALPPHAPSGHQGLRNVAEVLTLLNHVGVQAGPSQGLHVHVNVGRPGEASTEGAGAGASLTTEQIANVWTQYAKFQYVIDEMLQDSRVGSEWAQGLRFNPLRLLGPHGPGGDAVDAPETYVDAVGVFNRLFQWVNTYQRRHAAAEFCDWASGAHLDQVQTGRRVCKMRYPTERYMQVNLVVLNKYGTLEFRAFPATTSPERAVRWVKFVVQFVEAFKDHGEFLAGMKAEGMAAAREALAAAQARATFGQLATALGMDRVDAAYWRGKSWMAFNPACGAAAQASAEAAHGRQERAREARAALSATPKFGLDKRTMQMVPLGDATLGESGEHSEHLRAARSRSLVRSGRDIEQLAEAGWHAMQRDRMRLEADGWAPGRSDEQA